MKRLDVLKDTHYNDQVEELQIMNSKCAGHNYAFEFYWSFELRLNKKLIPSPADNY
ncbi:MAG: hypothetical protein WBL68_04940 [Nitrososphaeraceae archaeon]